MKYSFSEKASQIWRSLSEHTIEGDLDLEIYKKLFNAFHIGSYYYYVFNAKHVCFDFMSPQIKDVLGYKIDELDVTGLIEKIHPEDQPYFLNYELKTIEFFSELSLDQIPKYKISYDYRLRKKNGEYIRILQQVLTIDFNQEGTMIRTLGVHTDISHIKSPHNLALRPALSFIGLNGEPSYYDIDVKEIFKTSSLQFTKRENEILICLVNGLSSTKISNQLHISKLTVDTHRKNLLAKMKVSNTAELISKSIKLGLV